MSTEILNPHTGRPYPKDFFKDLARGQLCQIRVAASFGHGGCSATDTTVLCHYRLGGLSGIALKSPDLLAAWGCAVCHGLVDRQIKPLAYDPATVGLQLDKWHLEGVLRTLHELRLDGYLP